LTLRRSNLLGTSNPFSEAMWSTPSKEWKAAIFHFIDSDPLIEVASDPSSDGEGKIAMYHVVDDDSRSSRKRDNNWKR
jgi:hypothetical protein